MSCTRTTISSRPCVLSGGANGSIIFFLLFPHPNSLTFSLPKLIIGVVLILSLKIVLGCVPL